MAPLVLGVSDVFDSFDAVMRLAQLTGMLDEFGDYASMRKASLFYEVASQDAAALETGTQTAGMVVDRRARRAERRGPDQRGMERRVRQVELAHAMGQGAADRRHSERRTGERRTGERRSKEN